MIDVSDCRTWPLADLLPLARPDPHSLWPELGVLTARQPLLVYLTDCMTPGLEARLRTCEKVYYKSAEELTGAGWRVD